MAEEKTPPAPWKVWRGDVARWRRPFLFFEWLCEWAVYRLQRWAFIELLGLLGQLTILVSALSFLRFAWNYDAIRESQRRAEESQRKAKHYQAWQVINAASGKAASGGRQDALRDLVEDGVSLVNIDLDGANLTDANLTRANLDGAHLAGANLTRTTLTNAGLRNANLEKATLTYADLTNALLTRANLEEADLTYADLKGAMLRGAILRNTNLRGANLQDATLTYENGPAAPAARSEPPGGDAAAQVTRTQEAAYLAGAKLSGANLKGADLEEASLAGANLEEALLSNANLEKADLTDATLTSAELTHTKLTRARGLDCTSLKTAKNWANAFRDEELACGAPIPPKSTRWTARGS